MNSKDFEQVVSDQIKYSLDLLLSKGNEYSTEGDKLIAFKKAAALQSITPKQALFGMASKHFVSLGDMIHDDSDYSEHRWTEKITDSINYLLLLNALVREEKEKTIPLTKG